jgi:hypothetical protein
MAKPGERCGAAVSRCGSPRSGALRRLWLPLAMPFCALLLAACADAGLGKGGRTAGLTPGVSTQADAIAKFGPPVGTTKMGSRTALQWIDQTSSRPVHIVVLFGMDGRMIEAVTDAPDDKR